MPLGRPPKDPKIDHFYNPHLGKFHINKIFERYCKVFHEDVITIRWQQFLKEIANIKYIQRKIYIHPKDNSKIIMEMLLTRKNILKLLTVLNNHGMELIHNDNHREEEQTVYILLFDNIYLDFLQEMRYDEQDIEKLMKNILSKFLDGGPVDMLFRR